jgi:hypothetical protein
MAFKMELISNRKAWKFGSPRPAARSFKEFHELDSNRLSSQVFVPLPQWLPAHAGAGISWVIQQMC